MLGVELSI